MTRLIATLCIGGLLTAIVVPPFSQGKAPLTGVTLPARVVAVYDGDTDTVDVTMRLNVRLMSCWAPELAEAGGKESADALREAAQGKTGTLFIPLASNPLQLAHAMTFDRVLAYEWIDGQDEDLSAMQVRTKHAASAKDKPLGQ